MNILTDVLSLIRRNKFSKIANPNDVLILGVNEEPDITGVASPIPYKSIKVIKVKDFIIAPGICTPVNSPEVPFPGTGQIFQKTETDPVTEQCTAYFRSLKSISSNITFSISADDNYLEIDTSGEPNSAANVGTGVGIWKDKVGETLNFKSLTSADSSITITQNTNNVDFIVTDLSLWIVGASGTGSIKTRSGSNTSTGNYSVAQGQGTIASNTAAHSEGATTIASGYASHAEGTDTEAAGNYSHYCKCKCFTFTCWWKCFNSKWINFIYTFNKFSCQWY